MRPHSPYRPRPAAAPLLRAWLHGMLALALMVQALTMAASAAAGAMHRHTPVGADQLGPPLQVLVDFRRALETSQAVAHVQPARHHHGPSVADVVRTPDDQAADRSTEVADNHGLSAQLALLPASTLQPVPMTTPPQVAREPWMATMHEPALLERPPRAGAPGTTHA